MTNQTPSNPSNYQEDEIDLRQLFRSLADRKWFIFGFTALVCGLAVAYAMSISPTYKATISFLSPSESSVIELNKTKLANVTSETIYREFLNNVMSSQFQRQVFDDNDYLTKLNPDNQPIENLDDFYATFVASINIDEQKIKKNVEKLNYEKPVHISMEGGDAKVISSFLNDIAKRANRKTVDDFITNTQLKTALRLYEIDKQKELLLIKAKEDRLSTISRIKEEDQQKINEINDQIERLRVKAKKDRLNKIRVLSDSAQIAKSLGIKDNNFKKINSNNQSNSTLTVAIGDNQKLPKWYLYGEDALNNEIKILKNRENDDPYVPEIVNLQNKLNEINSNQTLKTLEKRKDDSPFIAEINKLDVEAIKLKSYQFDEKNIHAMQINQWAFVPEQPIKPKKRLIVAIAAIAGFILSVLLVLLMNAFRKEKS